MQHALYPKTPKALWQMHNKKMSVCDIIAKYNWNSIFNVAASCFVTYICLLKKHSRTGELTPLKQFGNYLIPFSSIAPCKSYLVHHKSIPHAACFLQNIPSRLYTTLETFLMRKLQDKHANVDKSRGQLKAITNTWQFFIVATQT